MHPTSEIYDDDDDDDVDRKSFFFMSFVFVDCTFSFNAFADEFHAHNKYYISFRF